MTTIRKCLICGWGSSSDVCKALQCKVGYVRRYGELFSFPGMHKFIPKSDKLSPVVIENKSFDECIDFLFNLLKETQHDE
ncbi:MAG: hypothetical protein IKJ67_03855 [Bacteroidales bacterium]|nr:hypothetical protein [Bacteroidales bacterium]